MRRVGALRAFVSFNDTVRPLHECGDGSPAETPDPAGHRPGEQHAAPSGASATAQETPPHPAAGPARRRQPGAPGIGGPHAI
jgi:hypothetical protein